MARKEQSRKAAAGSGGSGDALRRLLDLLQANGLKVGDQLPSIRQLATLLQLKPTVVRDTLMQAQTMGLLRILPRSGAFIQSLTYATLVEALSSTIQPALMQVDHNLFHLLDARRVLEIELVGRASEQRRVEDLLPVRQALDAMACIQETQRRADYVDVDVRFHVEIARLAGNSVLLTFEQALLGLLKPYLAQLPWTPQRRRQTDQSHAAIYAALVEGDAEKARSAMREHLNLAYQNLLHEVRSLPAGGGELD